MWNGCVVGDLTTRFAKGGSASPKTMPRPIAKGASSLLCCPLSAARSKIRRPSRVCFANALRTTRSTFDNEVTSFEYLQLSLGVRSAGDPLLRRFGVASMPATTDSLECLELSLEAEGRIWGRGRLVLG